MKNRLLLECLLLLCVGCGGENYTVQSPDRRTWVEVRLDDGGHVGLAVSRDGESMLEVGNIGMDVREDVNLDSAFRVQAVSRGTCDSEWVQLWGENKTVRENYESLVVQLGNELTSMTLEVKVFDDGVGFRYAYHPLAETEMTVMSETTRFAFARDGECWSIPANFESYEFLYRRQPLSQTADASTPLTIRFDQGGCCSLHEAALGSYAEMALRQVDSLTFQSWLSPDNSGSGSVCPLEPDTFTSWRTLIVGDQAVDLINSTIVLNLNEPPARPMPVDHIRPMKYVGVWWGMHLGINSWIPDERHGATTENIVRHIDFAADNNIDAVLFEGWNRGWEQWGGSQEFDFTTPARDVDLDSVVAHARRRGVALVLHHETGGNIPNYERQLDTAFRYCVERGIYAVKTGYAGGFPERQLHHSHYGIAHYRRVMEAAARQGVMLDVHEPIKPTGLRRTCPNLMTGEGVRGMEWNAWSDGNPPSHQLTLPFTRMLAGPIDYTPGIFDITYRSLSHHPEARQWNQQDSRKCRVHTTLAKQCALWVILYSPWVMAADLIENYEGHPMFQFFRDYNPDCDWSCALQGEPGEYVVIVRRAGEEYFIGAATDENPRTLEVPLDFLRQGEPYRATIYADAADAHYLTNPTAYSIDTVTCNESQRLKLRLAPGGGAAVRIKPVGRTSRQQECNNTWKQ